MKADGEHADKGFAGLRDGIFKGLVLRRRLRGLNDSGVHRRLL
jgi:hypothetical protein